MADKSHRIQIRISEAHDMLDSKKDEDITFTRATLDFKDSKTGAEFGFSVMGTQYSVDRCWHVGISALDHQVFEQFCNGLQANVLLGKTECLEMQKGQSDDEMGATVPDPDESRSYQVTDSIRLNFPVERPNIAIFCTKINGEYQEAFVMPYQNIRRISQDSRRDYQKIFMYSASNWKTLEVLNLPTVEELAARNEAQRDSRPVGMSR